MRRTALDSATAAGRSSTSIPLDERLDPLCELTADDLNPRVDRVTVAADACVKCGGDVYVPRGRGDAPDYCPACRSDLATATGHDPGWTRGRAPNRPAPQRSLLSDGAAAEALPLDAVAER